MTEAGARSCLECSGKLPSTQVPAAPASLKAQMSQLGANKEQAEHILQAEDSAGERGAFISMQALEMLKSSTRYSQLVR